MSTNKEYKMILLKSGVYIMRIMFDTNVLLQRESNQVLSEELSDLLNILKELKHEICIHSVSLEQVENNPDKTNAEINYSKLKAYTIIKSVIAYTNDNEFMDLIKDNSNDYDYYLLYEIYKDNVDYVITDNINLLSKAEILNFDKKILNINEAIILFSGFLPNYKINILPFFKIERGYNLNLNDSIFDTLKEEYKEFNSWWKNSASKRQAYVYIDEKAVSNNKVKAILVPKIENEEIECYPELKLGKCVKICLFKVSEQARGLKLGERLLSMAFEFAQKNNLTKIYLTHFTTKNDSLVKLIEEYGFYKHGKNKRGEEIFVKYIDSVDKIEENKENILIANKKFYPSFYDGYLVNKHIVPIYPEYHEHLFPDCKNYISQLRLFFLNNQSSEGNSIKKAYICNSPTRKVQKGDILLFYRTDDKQCITTLGVVEDVYYNLFDADEISKLIFKRTVYNYQEISDKTKSKNGVVVILFKQNVHLLNVFSYKQLKDNKIVTGPIQTITEISDESYNKIAEGNIDGRFIINKARIC